MRTMMCGLLVLYLVLDRAGFVRSEDPSAEVQAVLGKAIQAMGGAERMAKHKASTWKAKGTFLAGSQGVEFTGAWWVQPPEESKSIIEFDLNGTKSLRVQVINGERGWLMEQGVRREMSAGELNVAGEGLHASRVGLLLPLRDPAFKLTPLGETKVGERPALGIKVAYAGHADLN